jgi:2'-5' RNA ligase
MTDSAIIVTLALPRPIEAIRRAHVPVARFGVPPHVTILYPFIPPDRLTPDVRVDLAGMARETRRFDVRFTTAGRWPGIVYLEPTPAAPFSAMIDRVAARFPEHPPYAGTIAAVIPHLTVVEDGDPRIDELAAEIGRGLPFEAAVTALDVIASGPDGRWRRRWRLPLRP